MRKIHFEKLTPIKDAELKIYSDALDFVFENDDIKNIAISGAYSAGKSSIIESYKHKHKEFNFLHISLANFESAEKENSRIENVKYPNETDVKENSNTYFVKDSRLEGKILNQLLHQIDVVKIPQTNFRVKRKISNKSNLRLTLIVMLFTLAAFHIYFFSSWCKFIGNLSQPELQNFLKFTTTSMSLLISGLIAIIITSILFYNLIKIQRNKSIFKRFKFQGNEIEIFEKSDESYFDKYLNEVLYLFDNTGANAIVFEDMDRYNIYKIFQHLREVNTLINVNRVKENKNPIRFFYLVRDDIFIFKDRTKFFDFIMPVVPVIDSSNSYDQFISHLKIGGVFGKFEENFLQKISLYVDDMRILKNIYNEFIIYYNKIGTTEQDYNKLLAMIVYKNIFPRDFSETQLNIGFISTLFNNKDIFISKEIDTIDLKIIEINSKIEMSENEHARNILELNKIYQERAYGGNVYIDAQNPEYIKRTEIIDLRKNNKIGNLKKDIMDLENKKIVIRSQQLQKIITRENIDSIFSTNYKNFLDEENDFKEIKASKYFDLIKYLIWNGYIDETYEDYMTYFYPNSLTSNDKMFLRSITDKKAKAWIYGIDNVKLVLSKLQEVDFREIEIFNFSLFTYILNTEIDNKKYLVNFIEQLKKEKYFIFMKEYFNIAPDLVVYVKSINSHWPSFADEIINRSEFSYEEKKRYMLLTIYNCDNENLDMVNSNSVLSETISSDPIFLDIENPNIEKLIAEFKHLNIKFKCLDYEKSNINLFNAVYWNKLYELNFDNISLILRKIYNIQNLDDIKYKNYSLIMTDTTSKLFEYD
ncbi:hypothetical protein FDC35_06875 [Clostridium botulinum]|nr:hypothetical protein [Clostridium botulinum]